MWLHLEKGGIAMIYGYARVSTRKQDVKGNSLEDQQNALLEAGCAKIFHDSYTGTKMDRPEFTKLLEELKSGDRLVVTKLDRFARTTAGGIETIRQLLDRGVSIHILNMGLIDNTPTGRLIVTILLAFAEFERDMIVERTQGGKEIAKTKPGWKDGRKETVIDEELFAELRKKQARKEITIHECCELLGISESGWRRRVNKAA